MTCLKEATATHHQNVVNLVNLVNLLILQEFSILQERRDGNQDFCVKLSTF